MKTIEFLKTSNANLSESVGYPVHESEKSLWRMVTCYRLAKQLRDVSNDPQHDGLVTGYENAAKNQVWILADILEMRHGKDVLSDNAKSEESNNE